MTKDREMLGWAEVQGWAPGNGKIRITESTAIGIERDGIPAFLSIHWCDVNVETISPLTVRGVSHVGDVLTIPGYWDAIQCGEMPTDLPATTVREPILIGVPVGNMGARG